MCTHWRWLTNSYNDVTRTHSLTHRSLVTPPHISLFFFSCHCCASDLRGLPPSHCCFTSAVNKSDLLSPFFKVNRPARCIWSLPLHLLEWYPLDVLQPRTWNLVHCFQVILSFFWCSVLYLHVIFFLSLLSYFCWSCPLNYSFLSVHWLPIQSSWRYPRNRPSSRISTKRRPWRIRLVLHSSSQPRLLRNLWLWNSSYPSNTLQMDIPSSSSTGEVSSTFRRHSGASAQQSPQVRCSRLIVQKLEPAFRPTRNRRSPNASNTLRIWPRPMAPNECSLRGQSTGRFTDSRLREFRLWEIPGSIFQQGVLVLPHLGLRCNGRICRVPTGWQILKTRQDHLYIRDYLRFTDPIKMYLCSSENRRKYEMHRPKM